MDKEAAPMQTTMEGGCHCGRVRFRVTANFDREGLQGHQLPHALDRDHHRAAADFSADRALAAGHDAMVSHSRARPAREHRP